MHYLKDIKAHVDGRSCYGRGLGESNERRHQRWVKMGEGPCVVNVVPGEMFILGSGTAAHDRDKVFWPLLCQMPCAAPNPGSEGGWVLGCSRTWVAHPLCLVSLPSHSSCGRCSRLGRLLGCWCVAHNKLHGILLFLHGQPGSEALMPPILILAGGHEVRNLVAKPEAQIHSQIPALLGWPIPILQRK